MDCGGNVPLEFIDQGIILLGSQPNQLIHGSRRLPSSKILKSMSLKRQVLSWIFSITANYLLDIPSHLTDTQCGFKFYSHNTAEKLYKDPILDGFLFDLEIILRAHREGIQIIEFPIHWSCDPDSRLHPGKIIRQVIKDLFYLRKAY
jgi:dolichyl-phosphate beta-glucosyltransferase